ncbi:serine/arginine repetitive matrix protein 1-like [Physeter macrocephalus]|uniref:Serine/arginine repetitive matrix protein 1-like n=1 Tax=Physeter macrocephalus TaxID=9755 RepID=A0A455BH99_PHYMC|nr:serine/arginine repetitive matrix protein 1-like [Physeter catodon]|eukprot:XP_028347283.1 collagen alpha-1(I) chain-like [Physeter catodon]
MVSPYAELLLFGPSPARRPSRGHPPSPPIPAPSGRSALAVQHTLLGLGPLSQDSQDELPTRWRPHSRASATQRARSSVATERGQRHSGTAAQRTLGRRSGRESAPGWGGLNAEKGAAARPRRGRWGKGPGRSALGHSCVNARKGPRKRSDRKRARPVPGTGRGAASHVGGGAEPSVESRKSKLTRSQPGSPSPTRGGRTARRRSVPLGCCGRGPFPCILLRPVVRARPGSQVEEPAGPGRARSRPAHAHHRPAHIPVPLGFRGPCAAGIPLAAGELTLVAPPSALPARQPEPDEGRQDRSAPLSRSSERGLDRRSRSPPAQAAPAPARHTPITAPHTSPSQSRLHTPTPPHSPPPPPPGLQDSQALASRETLRGDLRSGRLTAPSKARLKSCPRDSELIAENSDKISLCVFQLLPRRPSSRADPDVSSKAPGESLPTGPTAHSSREQPPPPPPQCIW